MPDAIRVLSQLVYLDIFKTQSKTGIDLKGWLANQKYLVDSGMTATNFVLRTHDSDGLRAAFANDCNRMSMAAIETISGVQGEEAFPRSSGWPVIRSYYASFFAAHALLRMFGCSYSQLEFEYVNKIYNVAKTLNVNGGVAKIDPGLYQVKVDRNFTTLTFEKKKESHKDLWRGFLGLITQLDIDLANTSALSVHRIQAHDLLVEVNKGITRGGTKLTGNWLSELRNQVNYQHSHGAWYPYEIEIVEREAIDAIASTWKKPSATFCIANKHKELDTFFESTALLVSLFREVICVCSEKVNIKKSVFENGAIRLLHTIKAG